MFLTHFCQLVDPYAAVGGRDAPLGFDQFFLEKALERRIKRAFFDLKQIVRSSLDVLRERIAVEGLALESAQNHHLQCAGKEVSLFAVFHESGLLGTVGIDQFNLGLDQNSIGAGLGVKEYL